MSMVNRSLVAGLCLGVLLGGGATALWQAQSGDEKAVPTAASYSDAFAVMAALRDRDVPCETNIPTGKYPEFSCTLEGRRVRVISTAQGGPDVMPRGPALTGPNWTVATDQVPDLLRIREALGGELR